MLKNNSQFLLPVKSASESNTKSLDENSLADEEGYKPFVSLVVPAYNETPIVVRNLTLLCQYMESLEDEYNWEIVIVNDGSTDETGELFETFVTRNNISVVHHALNLGLGQALQSGFHHCRGRLYCNGRFGLKDKE